MFSEFFKIFLNKKNIFIFFILYFFIFFLFRTAPDFLIYWEILNSKSFSLAEFGSFFWLKTIGSFSFSLFWANFLAIVIPFLISINIILFKELYKKQKIFLQGKSFFAAFSGVFFGFFGAGCAACSGILFAPLISALGLTTFFNILPYKGVELPWVGIFILILSSLYILKKIIEPMICK